MLLETEDPRHLAIAGAIADGSAVDWTLESTHGSSADAALVDALQAVERIVSAHRSVGGDVAPTISQDVTPSFTDTDAHPSLDRWAHLSVGEAIGRGAFGVVYRAHDSRLAIDVALKLGSVSQSSRSAGAASVLEEAQRLARVKHPNVIRVYGADQIDGRVGIWMELLAGRNLEEILATQGTFSAREAALVGLDLVRALSAVHKVGLVHGDIKATNVMREAGGRTVLMDFGASREPAPGEQRRDGFRGTPLYAAPEVLAGAQQGVAADVYALGVLLFHLVTGAYPVHGRTKDDIALMHERGERRQLRDLRPDLPDEFVRVIARATAASPDERYRTAGEFEGALARFIDPSVPLDSTDRKRRLGPAIFGGLVLTSAAVAAAVLLWLRPGAGTPQAYDIDAAFYRTTGTTEERLQAGQRLTLGDRLSFALQTTVPVYLYIVNEPEQGEPYLLFPLPGQARQNPLPADTRVRIPEGVDWQVTSAGGREHFVVFISPQRVEAFDQVFASLATPRVGEPIVSAPVPADALARLRGVGGLTPSTAPPAGVPRLSTMFSTPMTGQPERSNGLWVRLLTLDNPLP